MSCTYTYKNKDYSESEFKELLATLPYDSVSKYMPSLKYVPPAPFISNTNKATNAYITLLMKKALIEAVSNDHTSVSWTTGDQQADRYDLRKSVKSIEAVRKDDGNYYLIVNMQSGDAQYLDDIAPNTIENYVGKDLAKKIIEQSEGDHKYSGVDLKVGGEWAQSMYGNEQGLNLQGKPSLISQAANDIFKHVGSGKVESINGQPGFYVTPEMRSKDLPLFSRVISQDSEYLDAVNSGDMEKAQKLVNDKLAIIGAYWHGTPSGDLRGGMTGLHVGTKQAAMEALEARIGIPADGRGWDGTREYGKTLLAGRDRVASGQFGKYRDSGYNMDSPKDDFYAEDHELPTVGNDVKVDPSWKPWIRPVLIVGDMDKRKKTDSAANSLMYKLLSQGKATRGFYYENDGEDAGSVSAVLPNGDHVKIKLPDAVTYDDEGNVIPLSERFNKDNNDIRFSRAKPVTVNGIERPTTNSEGKQINNPVNFWKWFGDSEARLWPKSSRGDRKMAPPLVFYHGTKGDFNEFVIGSPGTNSTVFGPWETKRAGMFFTQDKKFAESFATQGDSTQGANIIPVYLKVENAIDLTEGFTDDAIIDALAEKGVNPRLMHNISADQIWGMFDEEDDGTFFVSKLKELGYDGAIIVEPNTATEDSVESWVVFSPNQIKSAIGNNGEYSSANNDIRFSKEAIPEETTYQKSQRIVQDKFNRFSVIRDWLKERGVKLTELSNVYDAEERYHAKVANQVEDFREQIRNPLIEKIAKAGFTMDDIADYLEAQHAPEANEAIRKLRDDPEATAYGIADDEAKEYLSKAPGELGKLANELRSITEQTKKLRLDGGLLNKDITDAWEATYKHYIPVKGAEQGNSGTGKGMSVKVKNKRRLGHGRRDEAVIENILQDHERAIMEVEKNRVGKHVVMMAAEIGIPELMTIGQPAKRQMLRNTTAYEVQVKGRTKAVFDTKEGANLFRQSLPLTDKKIALSDVVINPTADQRVVMSASPMLADNEINVYIDGHAIRVQINDELMARAYKKLGIEGYGEIVSAGRMLNSYLSKVYTGYNPEFIMTNMVRDFTTGVINLTGEQGLKMAAKAISNYPKSFATLLRYAATNGKQSTDWIDAYRRNGGNTGAAYLSDMERLGNEVASEYAAYQGVIANLKQGDMANAARAAGRKAYNATLKWIYNLNQAGENAMRLSAFKAMIDSGMNVNDAAKAAKNITVNFNRKGELGVEANAAYLFFNASVQGTAATLHALVKGKNKYQAWALASGLTTLGYLAAASLGGGGEDDYDKIDDYTKERNAVIKYGDGYLKLPIPYGYGFFWNIGRSMADAQRKDELHTMPWHIAASAIEELTPFGSIVVGSDGEFKSDQVLGGALPTVAQIPYQISNNKQLFSGGELMPDSPFDQSQPDREKMWRGTKGTMYDQVSGWLAGAGMDVSPETLKFMTRTATGGAGALVDSSVSAAMLKADGAELDSAEMPFIRKAYKEISIKDTRSAFYKAREEAKLAAEEFNRARRKNDLVAMQTVINDKKEMLALDAYADKLSEVIRYARDQQDAVRLNKDIPIAEKRLRLKELEMNESKFYDKYLDVFNINKIEMKKRVNQ